MCVRECTNVCVYSSACMCVCVYSDMSVNTGIKEQKMCVCVFVCVRVVKISLCFFLYTDTHVICGVVSLCCAEGERRVLSLAGRGRGRRE